MGLGALSLLSLLMWWSWLRSNPALSRPCYARRLNFHVRLVCAHSPNSPIGAALTPPALASAGVAHRLARIGLEVPQIARFSLASACRASAFCIASRVARFSLLAVPHAPARLGVAYAPPSPWSQRNRAPHSRCCDFHSVLFLCLPLCACQALLLWP